MSELNPQQQAAIVDAKNVLESKQDVLMAIGQIQALNNIKKYTTVGELLLFKKVKDSKQYKGLVYTDDSGKSMTVGDIKELCQYFFGCSYSTMAEGLQNLESFGQEFLESSQRLGLGNRELRQLRKLPTEKQKLIIESEEINLGDKEAVKELIEDQAFKHATEIAKLENEIEEANQTVSAVRENSAQKQVELDKIKELEAKRKFSQEPWKNGALDAAKGMLQARTLIIQGVNQLKDIFESFQNPAADLDDKALDYIARSLLAEVNCNTGIINELTEDVYGILGGSFQEKPDLSAEDVYNELELGADVSAEE